MHRGVMFQFFEWHCPADGSLWRTLASRAGRLAEQGVTGVWVPPAYKGFGGAEEVGYAVYDLYDLGEFDQKGTVRTKYGTRDEFLEAVRAVQDAGLHIYADVVLNHRLGGDETEEVEIEEIDWEDRHSVVSDPYTIRAWSKYTFPGRGDRHSSFQPRAEHFTAFGVSADAPDEHKIYRIVGKSFADEVSDEYGNFDYLMGANVDFDHPEVREDLFHWGRWFVDLTGVHGFRLDAIKHIPVSFMRDWMEHMRGHFRGHFSDRELFAVGEYWSNDLHALLGYIEGTNRMISLLDVPLHFNFMEAGEQGADFDLSTIFDGTLVETDPEMAVTFVDNHDSQPGQALESWVADWFKPLAYALILLREHGYPCIFYGDYYGNDSEDYELTSHRHLLDLFMDARQQHLWGDMHDYFDHPNCIGWVWTGDEDHRPMAVVMSNSDEDGHKRMHTHAPGRTFHDITDHAAEPITTDDEGWAEFHCPAGKVSVWCAE